MKLKPCPFCGGAAYSHDPYENVHGDYDPGYPFWEVTCSQGCIATKLGDTKKEAEKRWNTRYVCP